MSGVFISNNALPRIGLNQYARNGLSPVAEFQNLIAERVGYAVFVRAKMTYRSPGQIYSAGASVIPASDTSERPRWRFAAHAAPYARYLFVRMWQARQSTGAAADCYSRLRVVDGNGALIGDAVRHFGSGTSAIDTPAYFGDSTIGLADTNDDLVDLPVNAPYFGTFTDFNSARLVAACVWEIAFEPNTDAGYPDISAGSGSPIYDKDRADAAEMANLQWAYGAQPLWHWSTDTDAGAGSQALGDLSGSLVQSIGEFTLSATGTVAGTETFDAVIDGPGSVSESGGEWTIPFSVTTTALGAVQNNGEFRVVVFGNAGAPQLLEPTAVDLDGWTMGTWSTDDDGRTWAATFTKASISLGSDIIYLSVVTSIASIGDSVNFFTNHGSGVLPNTDEATGVGNLDTANLTS